MTISSAFELSRIRFRQRILIRGIAVTLSVAVSAIGLAAQVTHSEAEAVLAEGVQLLRSGQAMQAKAKFDEAIKAFPRSADALTWRGVSENQLEQYEEAVSDFDAALKLSPSMLPAHYNLALSLIRLKKIGAAITQLQIVVKLQPDSVQTRYNLAVLLEGKGQWKEATEQLSAAHAVSPVDKGVTLHLLEDELKLKHFEAVAPLTSDLADPSTAPDAQRNAAAALLEAGRHSDAIILLESAHSRAPAALSTSLLLARILLIEDRAEEATELLSSLSVQGEGGATTAALTGVALAATHKTDEGIVALKKAIEQDPSLSFAHNVLGFCLFQQGRYAEAAEAYGSASRLEPERQLYARDAALAYERANQPVQALVFARLANEHGRPNANDHLMLGKLYASANQNEDAVRELLRASELNPDLEAADYLLARTYMKMENLQQAAVWTGRLTALKQKHEADSVKATAPLPVRSSTLLTGGSLGAVDSGAP